MCKDFWCIWSYDYNYGDPAFYHDEDCEHCPRLKDTNICFACGNYYEREGGCVFEKENNNKD